jgi:hypothetical protein
MDVSGSVFLQYDAISCTVRYRRIGDRRPATAEDTPTAKRANNKHRQHKLWNYKKSAIVIPFLDYALIEKAFGLSQNISKKAAKMGFSL